MNIKPIFGVNLQIQKHTSQTAQMPNTMGSSESALDRLSPAAESLDLHGIQRRGRGRGEYQRLRIDNLS